MPRPPAFAARALLVVLALALAPALAPVAQACPSERSTYRFASSEAGGLENGTGVEVTVVRGGGIDCASTVRFALEAETATADVDYEDAQGTLTFAQGQQTGTIEVVFMDDALLEGDETLLVRLSTDNNDPSEVIEPSTARVTIEDNETPPCAPSAFGFSQPSYSVGESQGPAVLTVTRTGGTNCPATARYALSPGTATAGADYAGTGGDVPFAIGETTKPFSVVILPDSIDEPDESLFATLTSVDGTNATLGSPVSATLTIVDDDDARPPTCAADGQRFRLQAAEVTISESIGTFQMPVLRDGASDCTASVSYYLRATGASVDDFTPGYGSVAFAAGETTKPINVPIINDTPYEDPETFRIEVYAVEGTNATLVEPKNATVTIVDDGAPPTPGEFGVFNATPASVQLPTTSVGELSAPPAWFELRNAGTSTSGTVSFSAPPGFTATPYLCDATLAAGAKCRVELHFRPTSSGVWAGNVTASASPGGVIHVPVRGYAWKPGDLEASPARVDAGTLFARQGHRFNVTLTNHNDYPTGQLRLVTPVLAAFHDCPAGGLAANASCTYDVRVLFEETGNVSLPLRFVSNDTGEASVAFNVTVLPAPRSPLVISPSTLDFGDQPEGVMVLDSVTVTNTGLVTVDILGANRTGDFDALLSACPKFLVAKASCRFDVRLTASALGERAGTVVLGSTLGDSNTLTLRAKAYDRAQLPNVCLRLKPGDLCVTTAKLVDTAVGSTTSREWVLENKGPTAARIYRAASGEAPFSSISSCGDGLEVGASCTLKVTFAPSATGAFQSSVGFFTNAAGWKRIDISAVAVPAAEPGTTLIPGPPLWAALAAAGALALAMRRRG